MSKLFFYHVVTACALGISVLLMAEANQSTAKQGSDKPTQEVITTDQFSPQAHARLVLGSGCFWGAEKGYEALPGVIDAVSGYADGQGVEPSYREITRYKHRFNPNNHAEVVEVTYDPNVITTVQLLQHFFEHHDPTQSNRQGNDVGTQYRSTILYTDKQQAEQANGLLAEYQQLLTAAGFGKIQTAIKSLTKFYPAEDYHQDYIAKNPNGYCPDHSTGVVFASNSNKTMVQAAIDNTALLKGKHIVMVDSRGYCPYCEKFKTEVANDYQGTIPMHYRYGDQLNGLSYSIETNATPTLIFFENGKQVHGVRGALSRKDFYQIVGLFKLGDSEAYQVAFEEGTDTRFCKQYQLFKNTGDGVFVDKISGDPLFDTRDRFNSGTGWLSFTQPVKGSVYEKADNRYGMRRVEIRARVSDIHLGHVFNDGPNGQPRYCINATVLEFKTRDEQSRKNI